MSEHNKPGAGSSSSARDCSSASGRSITETASALGLKAGDDCPKCGGELHAALHRFDQDGGAPDCAWLVCLDCNYSTEPE